MSSIVTEILGRVCAQFELQRSTKYPLRALRGLKRRGRGPQPLGASRLAFALTGRLVVPRAGARIPIRKLAEFPADQSRQNHRSTQRPKQAETASEEAC
mgnify:CR=1 FL=1